jgi:hypothetical protein
MNFAAAPLWIADHAKKRKTISGSEAGKVVVTGSMVPRRHQTWV